MSTTGSKPQARLTIACCNYQVLLSGRSCLDLARSQPLLKRTTRFAGDALYPRLSYECNLRRGGHSGNFRSEPVIWISAHDVLADPIIDRVFTARTSGEFVR